MAAVEFSADATLNTSQFASKAIGSSIASHRLLWLRQWQANARNKWRLACSPYTEEKLFGEFLDSILVESQDKRKIMPTLTRW